MAFAVQFKSDEPSYGIRLGERSTLKFDTVFINIGNGYDSHTGVFTAPVAGLYIFSLTAMSTNRGAPLSLALKKNGATLATTWGQGREDPSDQDSRTLPTSLAKGDKVWIAQFLGNGVRGSWWTTFTGFLN